ncbi:hypothetical protein ACKAV7_008423 [Fusarium commune]
MIQDLVVFTTPSYNAQKWHGTLMIWRLASYPEGMILILDPIGFFVILITLLVFRDNDNGTEVFTEWRNKGMGPAQNLSWFVGLLGCVLSFTRVDCSFQMCEEVRNPSLIVPRSTMGSNTFCYAVQCH